MQAVAKIAASEDVEGIRDEEDVDEEELKTEHQDGLGIVDETKSPSPMNDERSKSKNGKYVATLREVQEAFESVNTLRYSQPTHLQGTRHGNT